MREMISLYGISQNIMVIKCIGVINKDFQFVIGDVYTHTVKFLVAS